MLTIAKRPDGRMRISRNFLRRVDLTLDELRTVSQRAGIAQEWPDGFIDRLKACCGELVAFNNRLIDGCAPATVLGDTDAMLDSFGKLVSDFGIHRLKVERDEPSHD